MKMKNYFRKIDFDLITKYQKNFENFNDNFY